MRILLRLFVPVAALLTFAFALALLPEYFPDHGVIYRAIVDGDEDRARLMLDRGADPNSRDATLSELCWFLLRPRNPTHALPDLSEQPPLLSIAIYKSQLGIARILLEAGADPNALDEQGRTPLSYAALSDNPEFVRFLLDRGADAKRKMPDGSTALHEGPELNHRIRPEHPEVVKILRDAQ